VGGSQRLHGQLDVLPLSEVFQTRTPFFMPARTQPAGISVSIVEDDAHASKVLSDWIQPTHGFCLVNYHRTAESALSSLPREKPSVVLIDLNLPGIGASKCVRQLKPMLQQTQFVMLTADEDVDNIFNALAAGATGYLLKRTPRADLLAALKHIHAGGSPISSNIAKKVLQSFQERWPRNPAAELSPRENRILRLLARGSSYNDAATSLNISLPMFSTYIRSIYEKLQIHSNAAV